VLKPLFNILSESIIYGFNAHVVVNIENGEREKLHDYYYHGSYVTYRHQPICFFKTDGYHRPWTSDAAQSVSNERQRSWPFSSDSSSWDLILDGGGHP